MSHVRFEAKRRAQAIAVTLLAAAQACAGDDLPPPWPLSSQVITAYVAPEYSDPLSAPLKPTLDATQFSGSSVCGTCHTTHTAEWQHSMHANAMHDRVFQGLVKLQRVQRESAGFDGFCVQCHSPIALRGGQINSGFEFTALKDLAMEGITCEVCHRAQEAERPYGSGLRIVHDNVLRGPIEQAQSPHWTAASPLFEDSKMCATCHDVRSIDGKVELESPYEEWLASPAAKDGRTCQTCHMPSYRGKTAPGHPTSPERENLHRHNFAAIEPLADGAACREPGHLCSAAKLEAKLSNSEHEGCELTVSVHNLVEGHRFPTGSIFFRQAWLAVEVRDATDKLVFESGALDEQLDLRDAHDPAGDALDPQLSVFHGYLRDERGQVTLFPWRGAKLDSNAMDPGEVRSVVYALPETAVVLPLRATVRLRFRPFSPRLLRTIAEDALIDGLQVTDIAEAHATLEAD